MGKRGQKTLCVYALAVHRSPAYDEEIYNNLFIDILYPT